MKISFKKGALVAAATALTIAVPAAAHPTVATQSTGSNPATGSNHGQGHNHSSGSHRCAAHQVAFIVHGTVDSSQGAITVTNGTVSSGTLMLNVTRTNHWAKMGKTASQPVAYQLGPNTNVTFDGATTAVSAGERVTLIGKAPVISNKHCAGAGTVGTPKFRMMIVHPASS